MRILIVDDEPAMHDSYRRSFAPVAVATGLLDAMAAELFGDDDAAAPDETGPDFALTHCMQGLDAVAAVETALRDGDPFAVAFIDVRMPPGIDGKETAVRIRALDPNINLVIVTGYSDFSPVEISKAAGPADKIFYIAKPFEVAEVTQMASALAHRWQGDRELAEAREVLAAQVVQLQEQGHELAANESRAIHMANHDSLTEAPNRLAFRRALTDRARTDARFAVAMVDLDRFKLVNDTLGHLAGDELIRKICSVLQANVPAGGMVARLGGDEFGLMFDTPGIQAAEMDCTRVLKACSGTFKVLGNSVQGGASIGLIVTEAGESRDPTDLMRRADLALNDAKRDGRGVVRVFDESMDENIRLRRAIEGGPLASDCQGRTEPSLSADRGARSVRSGRVRGAAALEYRGSRAHFSRRVHPDRRGIEPHPRTGRLGAGRIAQGAGRVAGPICVGELFTASVPSPQFRRAAGRERAAGWDRSASRTDRDYRDRDFRRCRSRRRYALQAAPDGFSHRAG